jgi:hypothetical protein
MSETKRTLNLQSVNKQYENSLAAFAHRTLNKKIFIILQADHSARAKAWNDLARSNTGIMGSNRAHCMDVCFYSVFVSGWFLVQGVLPTV